MWSIIEQKDRIYDGRKKAFERVLMSSYLEVGFLSDGQLQEGRVVTKFTSKLTENPKKVLKV